MKGVPLPKSNNPIPLQHGYYYHVYNRGVNRQNIFFEERNYRYFLKLYAKHILPMADTFAYCLLPNHFHLLVRVKTVAELRNGDLTGLSNLSGLNSESQAKNLTGLGDLSGLQHRKPSQAFSNLFNAYTKAINKAYQRTGALFQRPFGRIPVTDERYFVKLITYIHRNPQKHNLTNDFRAWSYSSYTTLLSTKPTHLRHNQVLNWFDGRIKLESFHQQPLDEQELAPLIGDDFD